MSSDKFELALVFIDNNKKYTIPLSLLTDELSPGQWQRIKARARKEVKKL